MKLKNVVVIVLVLLGSIASLGCTGTSIKEINQNPQSYIGSSVELTGIVFISEENGLWFEFTDDRRIFERYSIDEYRVIYVYNTIGFDAEKQADSYKPGNIVVKGIIKQDDVHGVYIQATSITLK
jgi:hypothetical protein